jgi:hypothetical protein
MKICSISIYNYIIIFLRIIIKINKNTIRILNLLKDVLNTNNKFIIIKINTKIISSKTFIKSIYYNKIKFNQIHNLKAFCKDQDR